MGLADRFKEKLDKNKFFNEENHSATESLHKGKIYSFMTNSVDSVNDNLKKFEDLETDLIKKIRMTPCWNEYKDSDKKHMIGKYFDAKMCGKYSDISYNSDERSEFIKNIIDLIS